jgi:hypothetical protein
VLAARPDPLHSLVILLTDGEEVGLMGAAALVDGEPLLQDIRVYLNFEAIGSGRPVLLFEAGPGNRWVLQPWARAAPRPRGGSFAEAIYARLPNDTDFSILRRTGIPGLNFAAAGDSYAYHTARDTPDRLSPGVLADAGRNAVAIVEALDAADLSRRSGERGIYFDVAAAAGIAYGPRTGLTLTILAVALGALVWVRLIRTALAALGPGRLVLFTMWAVAGLVAVGAAMAGAAVLLRAGREVYHPWYALPGRFFLLQLAAGIAAGWLVARTGRLLPARLRIARHPALPWCIALPIWIALAGGAQALAPSATYLWTVPLLAAGVVLAAVPVNQPAAVRIAAVVVLGVAGTLWLRDTVLMLEFQVAMFGRMPIVTPIYAYTATLLAAAVMVAPPLLSVLTAGDRPFARPAAVTAACLLALAVAGLLAYAAPTYSAERPQRRYVAYIQDEQSGQALWEVGGTEPGLDLAPGHPFDWSPSGRTRPMPFPPRPPFPFLFHAEGLAAAGAPASLSVAVQPAGDRRELTVTVVPQETGLIATLVLPADDEPLRSNLPGLRQRGRWAATYVALPPEGIAFRVVLDGAEGGPPPEARLLLTTWRLPGGEGWQHLPPWLPQERAVWLGRAMYLLPLRYTP